MWGYRFLYSSCLTWGNDIIGLGSEKKRAFPKSMITGFHSFSRCSITTLLPFRSLCKMPPECMWSKALIVSFKIQSQVGLSSFFFLMKLDKVTLLSSWPWNFVMRRRGSLLVTIPKRRGTPWWSSRWLIIFASCRTSFFMLSWPYFPDLNSLTATRTSLHLYNELSNNFQNYYSPKTFPISRLMRDLSLSRGDVQLVSLIFQRLLWPFSQAIGQPDWWV